MKVCTFPNCAYLSETSRMIALYKEMQSRGIEVLMATHGGPYEWLFEEENIPYTRIEPHFSDARARDFIATNTGEKGFSEFYSAEELNEHVDREMDFFRDEGITKVITGFTLSCAISTRALGISYAVTHLGSFVPPVFERKMLVPTLITNSPITKIIPDSWLVSLINKLMYKSSMGTKSFNKVAKMKGIKPFHSMEEMMMGDLIVVTDVPEILTISREDLESWSSRGANSKYYSYESKLRYGGALYAKLFGEIPGEVEDFLKTDLPKVYVALTSGRSEVLQKVYEGIKDLPVRIIMCTTVHEFKSADKENLLVTDHLPSHKVMPLTDLVIIHGGQGSVQTAIASATPVIAIPLHVEQGLNAAMIERHGAGLMQIKHDIDPMEIRDKVKRILEDPSFKKNMEKISLWQNAVDGVKKAVDHILE